MPHNHDSQISKIKTTSTALMRHVTSDHRINNKLVATKQHQSYSVCTQKEIVVDIMQPVPNANSLISGSQIRYYVESNVSYNIRNMVLRFQVTVDTACNLPPVAQFFSRLEIYDRATNAELCRIYSDVLNMWVNRSDDDVVSNYSNLVNQSSNYGKKTGGDGDLNTKAGTHYYYLPLNYFFWEGSDLNLHRMTNDIEIRLHPNTSVMSPFSANNLQLQELGSVLEVEHPDMSSMKANDELLRRHIVAHTYCDVQEYVQPSEVINSGTRYEYDLDSFDEKSAGLLVCIKPQGSTNFECADLSGGSVDVISTSGESLYGAGRAVQVDYLTEFVNGRQYGNSYFNKTKSLYIPFSNHSHKSFSGVSHGYHQFTGSKKSLQINTAPAGELAEYVTNYSANTATLSGNVQFVYDGHYSELLSVTSTDGAFTTALNDVLDNYGLTATYVSDTATDKRIEFRSTTGGNVRVPPKFTVFFHNNVGGQSILIQAWNNTGVVGWANGTYDVYIYSISQKVLLQNNGRLRALDL